MGAQDTKKGQSLSETGPVAHVAQIEYHDGPILLPHGMSIPDARDTLKRRQEYLETEVDMRETFDVFPYDGAHAIAKVLEAQFGWVPAVSTPGFWGPIPPKMLTIEVGPTQKATVPWGRFSLPGVEGYVETSVSEKNNRLNFALVAKVLRKDEATIRKLFENVRKYLRESSIYRGKAIKIRFLDESGNRIQMPEPEFMHTDYISRDMLIYSKPVMDAVETNLFCPIERVADCIANGLPVKRGILLGGTYGTGKTLAAAVASRLAVDNGITYVYVPRADELHLAIEFAKQYQSPAAVIFCEDVDRVLAGERSVEMDDILNIIDGIDTKSSNIITVLTTNDLDAINVAMIRPGRLDSVIEVTAPDAQAVEALLRYYGKGAILPETDLTMAGVALAGQIPAVISEVIKRAKLVQLRHNPRGTKVTNLGEDAIVEASVTMKYQLDLLKSKVDAAKPQPPELDTALNRLVGKRIDAALGPVLEKLNEVRENQ